MYVAGLLTDWAIISTSPVAHPTESQFGAPGIVNEPDVYIGRSETTMWMRIISSWLCYMLYTWSLYVPIVLSLNGY